MILAWIPALPSGSAYSLNGAKNVQCAKGSGSDGVIRVHACRATEHGALVGFEKRRFRIEAALLLHQQTSWLSMAPPHLGRLGLNMLRISWREERCHHIFHGAWPDIQSSSSSILSRKVSMGCQKPSCIHAASLPESAKWCMGSASQGWRSLSTRSTACGCNTK